MAEQKSFWKRYEFLIIAAATLLFIYSLVVFNQKINFLLGNELIVYLEPPQESLFMHYGNVAKAEFDVSIGNVAYCKAVCSYSFNDRSANYVIDKNNFEIKKGAHLKKSYELGVKRLGSGQDIYSFDVKCRSIKSPLCLTKSPETSRTSLLIVNYDLTETEKELKETLKGNVTKLLELLRDVDIVHQRLNQKYFELGFSINLKALSKEKINIDDVFDKTRIAIENLRSLWSVENYPRLNSLFNEGFFENLYEINESLENLDKEIDKIAALHNRLLLDLDALSKKLKMLEPFINLLEDEELLNSFSVNAANFNKAASSLTNNTFNTYTGIILDIENIINWEKSADAKTRIPAAVLFFNFEYLSESEKDLLCALKNNCEENASIANAIADTEKFIEYYPNPAFLKQNCNSLQELSSKHQQIRNETLNFIYNNNITLPSDSEFYMSANRFRSYQLTRINNSYLGSFKKLKIENKLNPDVMKIAESMLPKNFTSNPEIGDNNSVSFSLHLLSQINHSDKTSILLDKCVKLNKATEKIGDFKFQPLITTMNYSAESRIDTILSDNPPICCIFNDCKPCCRNESCKNDPRTFPLIFLHGHSLAAGNSPEFSLDAFNKIQSKLQEEGYLNAGIISLYSKNEQVQHGIWGMSGKPVTVKASYYYDAFRKEDKYIVVPTKSENIDTYALRLKDLVDIIKQRSNKPKVNIIAHSMGGLVARRHIQIFGDSDIDKLIMIATPNRGISEAISSYCGIIGESRECKDMQENSLFMNKLNDPSKQPAGIRIYTIIGQGCQTKSGNGDGIVLTENAKMESAVAYFVNGTCDGLFGGALHTEILNINKYPKTYAILTEILER
ncbi:alpha/beta hydrolase [Candidatus Woesearchaeota archaeon]|nr:alpha/beta hydrolase [Candidatus Woesearchaeota archaeon]